LRKQAADRLQEAENRQADARQGRDRRHSGAGRIARGRVRAEERLTAADERRREVEARIQEALNVPPHLVIRHDRAEPTTRCPTWPRSSASWSG
jgi:chromosome segregation protein